MTVLSDESIHALLRTGHPFISPWDDNDVQPSSYDLHLGNTLQVLPYGVTIDPETDQSGLWQDVPLRDDGRWQIAGLRLYLGKTVETVEMPDDCVGHLHGVSTLGRQGLMPHVQAGLVDAGWLGVLTLEIVLIGQGMFLRPGMRIAQLTVERLSAPALRPYAGRYAGDMDVQPAKPERVAS